MSNGPAGFSGERKSPRDDDRWRDCWSSVGVFGMVQTRNFHLESFKAQGINE